MGQYKFFLYSNQQMKERKDVEKRIGKTYIPGTVLVNGTWKEYTEISPTSNSSYSDAKLIIEGDISNIKYKKSSSAWGVH